MLGITWRKKNPCTLLVGIKIGIATKQNSMQIPQKTKYSTIWLSNSTPEYTYGKTMKTLVQKDTYTLMFRAALFTINQDMIKPKCPSTEMNG